MINWKEAESEIGLFHDDESKAYQHILKYASIYGAHEIKASAICVMKLSR